MLLSLCAHRTAPPVPDSRRNARGLTLPLDRSQGLEHPWDHGHGHGDDHGHGDEDSEEEAGGHNGAYEKRE